MELGHQGHVGKVLSHDGLLAVEEVAVVHAQVVAHVHDDLVEVVVVALLLVLLVAAVAVVGSAAAVEVDFVALIAHVYFSQCFGGG